MTLVVDAFAGAGGWDQGLRLAGFTGTSIGLEWNGAACRTAVAAGHLRVRCDVATYPTRAFGPVDGFIGSPPCQPFTKTRHDRAGFDDPRGLLTREPIRWVRELMPRWVALEQVPGVLPYWHQVAAALRQFGYQVWTGVLNTANYGVPQVRRRACLLARCDGAFVMLPTSTHTQHPDGPDLFGDELEAWPVMADALDWVDDGTHPAWTFTRPSTTVCGTDRVGRPGHKDWSSGGESQYAQDAAKLTVAEAGDLAVLPGRLPMAGNQDRPAPAGGQRHPAPPRVRARGTAARPRESRRRLSAPTPKTTEPLPHPTRQGLSRRSHPRSVFPRTLPGREPSTAPR